MTRRRLGMAMAGTIAVVTLALSGCVPAPAGHVVFDIGAVVCASSTSLRAATLGIPIRNDGPGTAVIEGVGSGLSGNAKVTGPWIVPATSDDRPVFLSELPPTAEVDWSAKVDADGAKLAEGEDGYLVFAVELDDGETNVELGGVTVTYDGGRAYAEAKDTALKLAPQGGACEL